MSLQWTVVAAFLYTEIALVVLLLLPIIHPTRWLKIFRSRILHSLGHQTHLYFYGMLGLLILLFLDAIREMRKYAGEEYDLNVNPKAEMQAHMKLFRAQRNFYLSGFALFFWLIIRRLVTLISVQAILSANSDAALRQASSASNAASRLMGDSMSGGKDVDAKVAKLETQINELREEVERLTKDRDAIKAQADNLSEEYDRLAEEHSKLEKKKGVSSGVKKDD